jgi:hypothetical protein
MNELNEFILRSPEQVGMIPCVQPVVLDQLIRGTKAGDAEASPGPPTRAGSNPRKEKDR